MQNLKYQFLRAINCSFTEKCDKHSAKAQNIKNTNKIYSYSSRTNLIKMSSNFANFMKKHYPNIKYVKDITPEHTQVFLNSKNNGECSQATLNQYKSQLSKLSKVVNAKFHSNTNYTKGTVTPISIKNGGAKVRNTMLTEKDYTTLLHNSTNVNFKNALQLSYHCGLRACECAKAQARDYDPHNTTLRIIGSKGGRSRIIKLNTLQNAIVKNLVSKLKAPTDRLCPIQTESLQQAFRRELKKNGLSNKYTDTSFHACRKAAATRYYKECRKKGQNIQQSLNSTSNFLGHNDNRNSLMREYICTSID